MWAEYRKISETQPKTLCPTTYRCFGSLSGMRPVDKEAFGRRLKARREALGISQQALAEPCGMKQQSIGSIEKGKVKRPGRLREIAAMLHTTEQWLLWKEGPEVVDLNGAGALDYRQQAAEIAAQLSPDNRALWFQVGVSMVAGQTHPADPPLPRGKPPRKPSSPHARTAR